jgi:hypothetical protein
MSRAVHADPPDHRVSMKRAGFTWKHVLGGVRDYGDLEPELLGWVEELIDFLTA